VSPKSVLGLADDNDEAIIDLEPFPDACPKEGVVINNQDSDGAVWFFGLIHALPSSAGSFAGHPQAYAASARRPDCAE
jgi:hypothetical protein